MLNDLQALLLQVATKSGAIAPSRESFFRYVRLQDETTWTLVEETILNNNIKLSTANAFNDPFEGSPHIVNDISNTELFEFMDFAHSQLYGTEQPFFFRNGKITSAGGKELSAEEADSVTTLIVTDMLPSVFRNTRLASFCRRVSSQLIWAHYADGYKGLAYHFITSGMTGEDASSVFQHLKAVQYTRQRPIVSLRELLDLTDFNQKLSKPAKALIKYGVLDRYFRNKSVDWSYEEEYRIVLAGPDAVGTFHPRELVSIILGPLFPKAHEERLKSIVQRRAEPIRLYRTEISKTDYSIGVDWNSPISV